METMTKTKPELTAESLSRALRLLGTVHEKRNRIPILDCVHLEAAGRALRMTVTDLDMRMTVTAGADGDLGHWVAAVSFGALGDVLRLTSGPVALSCEGSTLIISGGSLANPVKVPGADPLDFPMIKVGDGAGVDMTWVGAERLADMLDFLWTAISTEETRYYLTGTFFGFTADKLQVCSTDGHRLNLIETDMPAGAEPGGGVIVPRKACKVFMATLKAAPKLDCFSVSRTHVALQAGPVSIVSKLIDGSFPDFSRVIPRENPLTVTVDSAALSQALAKVAPYWRDPNVALTFANGEVHLHHKPKDGDAPTLKTSIAYSGDGDIRLSVNASYIRDALASIGAGPVVFRIAAPHRGAFLSPIRIEAPDKADRLCVVMPLRI